MDLDNMSQDDKLSLINTPNNSEEHLREFAYDGDHIIRYYVAHNLKTPEDLLRHLAQDKNIDVRRRVCRNPNTPENVLRELIKDEKWQVRLAVIYSSKVSSNLLVMLFEHEKRLQEPNSSVIWSLYRQKELPYIARVVIETLFGDMI